LFRIERRKRIALEGISSRSVQATATFDRGSWESGYLPKPGPRYRLVSHEEWLAERARHAASMLRNCVEMNPRKRGGIPVLKGTRFTLAQILAEIAEGRDVNELAEDFELDLELIKEFLHGLAICLDRPAFK
jgi:uncharacterized protein (DUF433 family)